MKILQRLKTQAELEEVQCLAEIILEESMEAKELRDELIKLFLDLLFQDYLYLFRTT